MMNARVSLHLLLALEVRSTACADEVIIHATARVCIAFKYMPDECLYMRCLCAMRAALSKSSDAYSRYSDSATQRLRKFLYQKVRTMKRARSENDEASAP